MVVFTCSSCGSSLKKNQVEKHIQFQCRSSRYVSCMDCSQDFWGDEYSKHIKCLTEDEKYGGRNQVTKECKGDKKQLEWTTKIKNAISENPNLNKTIKGILFQMSSFNNIPKQEKKFKNFVSNSFHCYDKNLVEEVWQFLKSIKDEKCEEIKQEETEKEVIKDEETEEILKRKRIKNKTIDNHVIKKKRRSDEKIVKSELSENIKTDQAPLQFKWKVAIRKILKNSENGMKRKKLFRLVSSQYLQHSSAENLSWDELSLIFDLKLQNNKFEVVEDRIKLRET